MQEILRLWEADITNKDGAIQLLLIVDYICDWARSVHREAIIRELLKLTPPPPDNVSDLLSVERLTVDTYHRYRCGDGMSQDGRGSQQLQSPVTASNIHSPSPRAQKRLESLAS